MMVTYIGGALRCSTRKGRTGFASIAIKAGNRELETAAIEIENLSHKLRKATLRGWSPVFMQLWRHDFQVVPFPGTIYQTSHENRDLGTENWELRIENWEVGTGNWGSNRV